MMVKMFMKLIEYHRGTRGGTYYYILEDNVVKRIDYYSVSMKKTGSSRKKEIIYIIPFDRVSGKVLYKFSFSNNGYLYADKAIVSDPQKLDFSSIDENELINIVNKITVNDNVLYKTLQDYKQVYSSILNELRIFFKETDTMPVFEGHPERFIDFLENPVKGLVNCMVLPSDKSRLQCLIKPLSWIYQLWVLKKIIDALGLDVVKGYWKTKHFSIKQGDPYPSLVGKKNNEYYTFWHEPQLEPIEHLKGMFTKRTLHVRPDIVVAKGYFEKLGEAVQNNSVWLLIECKNSLTDNTNTIRKQLKEYSALLKPKSTILVSIKKIPQYNKYIIEREEDVHIIDELRPGLDSSLKKLRDTLSSM